MIKDFLVQRGAHLKFEITKELIDRSKASRSKYWKCLDGGRKLEEELQKQKHDKISCPSRGIERVSQKIIYFNLPDVINLHNK